MIMRTCIGIDCIAIGVLVTVCLFVCFDFRKAVSYNTSSM